MNQFKPASDRIFKTGPCALVRWLPHSLERQLLVPTAPRPAASILSYGADTALALLVNAAGALRR